MVTAAVKSTMMTVHGNDPTESTENEKNEKASTPAAMRRASTDRAAEFVEKMFRNSRVKDLTSQFPQFQLNEIQMGKILGIGGFGIVKEIRGFRIKDVSPKNKTANDKVPKGGFTFESRKFMAQHCTRPKSGDARYAIKYLSPEVVQDPVLYRQGICDMAVETRFLSSIEHPNIIKLRAFAGGKGSTVVEGKQQQAVLLSSLGEDYFIVLDRLYDTLEKRITKWGRALKKASSPFGKLLAGRKQKTKMMEERILVAFDLCAAIEYLHQRRIIYRDLKPENIGFDIRGDVKLFDFGLAKELTSDVKRYTNGTYRLTHCTGTLLYMAPEVYQGKSYNEKCDVYSMAILLWQIMSCKVPFEDISLLILKTKVLRGDLRPPIDVKKRLYSDWPSSIVKLLHQAWGTSIERRPFMCEFSKVLRNELINLRGGDATGLEHSRRRSTFVLPSAHATSSTRIQQLNHFDEMEEEDDDDDDTLSSSEKQNIDFSKD